MLQKCVTQARSWLVTIPADGDKGVSESALLAVLEEAKLSALGQLERGNNTGYLHWQLLIERESGTPLRFERLRKLFPSGHFEPRRGTVLQAMEYVTKEDTRAVPPVTISRGEIHQDEQGHRYDLDELHEAILSGKSADEVMLEYPKAYRYSGHLRDLETAQMMAAPGAHEIRSDLRVWWVYGAPGVGKTYAAYEMNSGAYRVSDYERDPFGFYRGEDLLVLDEYAGQLSYKLFLQVTDIYPLQLPCRYMNRPALFTRVLILSNESPWQVFGNRPGVSMKAVLRRLNGGVFRMEENGESGRRLCQIPRDDEERQRLKSGVSDSPFKTIPVCLCECSGSGSITQPKLDIF